MRVHDLGTIIVLVLLTFNLIAQWSHHSLNLTRSRIWDSGTVTLTSRMAQKPLNQSHRYNRSAYFPERKKSRRFTGRTITAKTLPCGTPTTTLTSLLRWLNLSKAAVKSMLTILASCPVWKHSVGYLLHTEWHPNAKTFPISEVGIWKHTSAFHKSPKMNRSQNRNQMNRNQQTLDSVLSSYTCTNALGCTP